MATPIKNPADAFYNEHVKAQKTADDCWSMIDLDDPAELYAHMKLQDKANEAWDLYINEVEKRD